METHLSLLSLKLKSQTLGIHKTPKNLMLVPSFHQITIQSNDSEMEVSENEMMLQGTNTVTDTKVSKSAKIRNRYN